jgi:hypothetical protein
VHSGSYVPVRLAHKTTRVENSRGVTRSREIVFFLDSTTLFDRTQPYTFLTRPLVNAKSLVSMQKTLNAVGKVKSITIISTDCDTTKKGNGHNRHVRKSTTEETEQTEQIKRKKRKDKNQEKKTKET